MITKVVPSGRGLSIAQRDWADSCDYSTLEWLECIIFVSGDERSRRPYLSKFKVKISSLFKFTKCCAFHLLFIQIYS